jgi:hypothetical protein
VHLTADEEQRANVVQEGAIFPLVHICSTSQDTVVLQYAVGALCNLSAHEGTRPQIMKRGGIQPLVQLCNTCADEQVLRKAVETLANLATHDRSIAQLLQKGAVKPLVALCVTSSDDTILMNVTTTIMHMVQSDASISMMIDGGVLEPLLKLCATSGNIGIVRNATAAVSRMCSRPTTRLELLRRGSSEEMVRQCRKSLDVQVLASAAASLMHLSEDEDSRAVLLSMSLPRKASTENDGESASEGGVVHALLEVLMRSTDVAVLAATTGALRNVALDERSRGTMVLQGAVPSLIRLLASSPTSPPGVSSEQPSAGNLVLTLAREEGNGEEGKGKEGKGKEGKGEEGKGEERAQDENVIFVLHERMLQHAAGVIANLAVDGEEQGATNTMVEQGVVEALVQLLREEESEVSAESGTDQTVAVLQSKRRFGRRGARVAPAEGGLIDRSQGPIAKEELGVVCAVVGALAVLARQADDATKMCMVKEGVARMVSDLHRPYNPAGGVQPTEQAAASALPPTLGAAAGVGVGVLISSATVLAELAQIDRSVDAAALAKITGTDSTSSTSLLKGSTREHLLDCGVGYALAALLGGSSSTTTAAQISVLEAKEMEKGREQVLLLASRAVGDICSVDDFGGMGMAGPAEVAAAVSAEGEGQAAGAGFFSGGAGALAAALADTGVEGAGSATADPASTTQQLSQTLSPADLTKLRAARAARLAKQGVLPPLVAAARSASYSCTRAHGELLRTTTRAVTALSCCLDRVGQLLQLGAIEPVLRLSELAQVGENASLGHVATALVNFSAADEHEGRHVSNTYAYIPALTMPRTASKPTDAGEEGSIQLRGAASGDTLSGEGTGAPSAPSSSSNSVVGPLLGLLTRTLDAHILGLALLALLQCARHGPSRKPMVHAHHGHLYYGHSPGHTQPQPQPQEYKGVVGPIVKLCTATTDAKCLAYGAQCLGTLALDESNRAPMVEQGVVTPLVQMCARAATATAQAKDSGDADEISDALEEVCANAAGALGILALHKPSRAHIVRQGAVPVLVALCGRGGRLAGAVGADGERGHGLTVLGNAAGALANLTLHEESRPRLVNEGAVAVLVPLLRHRHQPQGAGGAAVIGNAAQALAKLSLVDAARPVMIELGVVPPLVKICRGTAAEGGASYDLRTVSYAAEAMASLAVDESHRGLLVREGALPPLIELATIVTEQPSDSAITTVPKPSKTARRVIASAASALAQLAQHETTAARLLQLGAMRPLILLCEQYDARSPNHASRTHLGAGPSAVRAVQAAVEAMRHIGRRPECRVQVVRSGGAKAAAFVALRQNYSAVATLSSAATPPGAPGSEGAAPVAAAEPPSLLDEALLMHASGVLVNLAVEASTRAELVRGGGEGRLNDREGMVGGAGA